MKRIFALLIIASFVAFGAVYAQEGAQQEKSKTEMTAKKKVSKKEARITKR